MNSTIGVDVDDHLAEEYDISKEEVHETVKHVCRAIDPEIQCHTPLDTEAKKKFAWRILQFFSAEDVKPTEKPCGREHILSCTIDRNCPRKL